MDTQPTTKGSIIKNIYLYLVSFVALMMVVFSVGDMINIVLRTYIFTKADQNFYSYPVAPCAVAPTGTSSTPTKSTEPCLSQAEQDKQNADNISAQRQRDLVRDISFLIVGLPLFAYHWRIVRKKE